LPANHHGSLVILGDRGVLITGDPGSGKTRLALGLLTHAAAVGRFARLVSDDQVFLKAANGRLIGEAPSGIEGLAEARGFGPAAIPYERRAVVDLLVRLVPTEVAPRFREDETVNLEGVELPCLRLAERDTESALFAVAAWLAFPPFEGAS
jgi:Serine kinase of the HPr protein, regulates carbohydrate metabolism